MNIGELLDAAKRKQGIATDMALAEALDVSRSAVSSWRKGVQLPDTVRCAALAGLTGEPLARVLGVVGEARAISREEKAIWRKLAATAALLAVMVFPSLSSPAQAGERAVSKSPVVCIMRNYVEVDSCLALPAYLLSAPGPGTGLSKAVTNKP